MNRIKILILVFTLLMATLSCTKDSDIHKEPVFSTSDVDLFWTVFDSNKPCFNRDYFKINYVNNGSIGIKNFDAIKDICPDLESKLLQPVYLQYYNSIRNNTLDLTNEIATSKEAYYKFENNYSRFKPTNIYFLIGALTAGGKQTNNGLMIAVEFFTKTDTTSTEQLSQWFQNVLKEKNYIPSVVIHELAHLQQTIITNHKGYSTLLEQSIREGMADYISKEIIPTEPFLNQHIHDFADTIENKIWNEFKVQMNHDFRSTEWFYTGKVTSKGYPADLGYYVGFKIIESYAKGFNNQWEAIEAMLLNGDYYDIFDKSNYESKFQ